MLAPNFKTGKELGIPDKVQDALVKTLNDLETGRIEQEDFNMGSWCKCIYGHSQKYAEYPYGINDELQALFVPGSAYTTGYMGRYENITREKAAHATRNYVTTGDAKWNEVLEDA